MNSAWGKLEFKPGGMGVWQCPCSGWRWCLCPEVQQASGCASIITVPPLYTASQDLWGNGIETLSGGHHTLQCAPLLSDLFSSVIRQSPGLAALGGGQSLL